MTPPKFRVFLGAPSRFEATATKALLFDVDGVNGYSWDTVSPELPSKTTDRVSQRTPYAPATLEAASRRISSIYQHAIFHGDDDDDSGFADTQLERDATSVFWPPTVPQGVDETTYPSFLHSVAPAQQISTSRTQARTQNQGETQGTSFTSFTSYHSDSSSVAHFPTFTFSLHSLTSLDCLPTTPESKHKISVLLAVLELEGPDTITIRNGPDQGKRVSVLKMILSDERNKICKLTAWRDLAEEWGGALPKVPGVKRGDVVYLSSVSVGKDMALINLTASPFLKSKLEICYRTMPHAHEDMRFRPDLRLGVSDAAVRRVAVLVAWFEEIAGLKATS